MDSGTAAYRSFARMLISADTMMAARLASAIPEAFALCRYRAAVALHTGDLLPPIPFFSASRAQTLRNKDRPMTVASIMGMSTGNYVSITLAAPHNAGRSCHKQ